MRIFSLILCLSFSLYAPSSFAVFGRAIKAKQAERDLENLHFFYDNKGMILPPSYLPLSIDDGISGDLIIGTLKDRLTNSFGLIIKDNKIVGYHEVKTNHNNRVGVIGCAVCHSGRAAGKTYMGLGNKNIDIFKLATTAKRYLNNFEKIDRLKPILSKAKREERRELGQNSKYFMTQLSDRRLAPHTQGLISIGFIRRWFFQQQNMEMDTYEPGQVKIPAFWGYGEKRKVGSFSDGFGNGVDPGWAVAVELVAGQTPENVRKYEHKLHKAEDALANLLPPKYPFEINDQLANQGQQVFNKTCAKCHGQYSNDYFGFPIYEKPEPKPWRAVKTDPARLNGVTDLFRELVAINPLNDLLNATDLEAGYIAPRLHGIWARFPYLHNASVMNIYELMLPSTERTQIFSLRDAGELRRFDKQRLGLNKDSKISRAKLNQLAAQKARYIYDTKRHGHGNQGHYFKFMKEFSHADRMAVIEYLKTL